jgi:hypothetical protein
MSEPSVQTRRSETQLHADLKWAAAQWAWDRGFRALAFEVSAPKSNFRVDVAGYRLGRNSLDGRATVAVFECKQSRSDLLRDLGVRENLLVRLRELQERRIRLEELLRLHFPNLRNGDCLFPEWETFPGEQLQHHTWNILTAKIASIQRRLRSGIKFGQLATYHTANLHLLVVPSALVDPAELPPGWGLLELSAAGTLSLSVAPQFLASQNAEKWLERIAQRATRSWLNERNSVARIQNPKEVDCGALPSRIQPESEPAGF